MPNDPRSPIVNDHPFSAGCVFWFAVIGFALTMVVIFAATKGSSLPNWRSWIPADVSTLVDSIVSDEPVTLHLSTNEFQTVTIAGKSYRLEVARTDATREQGLSDRLSLPPGTGMRFIFDESGRYTFWMNKMHIPLDMIFLEGGVIVNIANNVPFPKTAGETPATIHPQQAFSEVIELPAGDADKLGLKIGQRIQLP